MSKVLCLHWLVCESSKEGIVLYGVASATAWTFRGVSLLLLTHVIFFSPPCCFRLATLENKTCVCWPIRCFAVPTCDTNMILCIKLGEEVQCSPWDVGLIVPVAACFARVQDLREPRRGTPHAYPTVRRIFSRMIAPRIAGRAGGRVRPSVVFTRQFLMP